MCTVSSVVYYFKVELYNNYYYNYSWIIISIIMIIIKTITADHMTLYNIIIIQCSPHKSNPLTTHFRLFRRILISL